MSKKAEKFINTTCGVFYLRKNGRTALQFEDGEIIRCTPVPFKKEPGDTIKISDISDE